MHEINKICQLKSSRSPLEDDAEKNFKNFGKFSFEHFIRLPARKWSKCPLQSARWSSKPHHRWKSKLKLVWMEDSDYLKLLTWLKINLCWFNVSLPRYDWSLYLTLTPLGRNSMLRFRNCHSVNVAWRLPKSLVQNALKYSCPLWKVNRRHFRLASLGYV